VPEQTSSEHLHRDRQLAVAALAITRVVGAVSRILIPHDQCRQWGRRDLRRTLYHHIQRLSPPTTTKAQGISITVTSDIEAVRTHQLGAPSMVVVTT
jgi:hypothetical protein